MIRYYKVVAYRDDSRWIAAKLIETLTDAEEIQARLYAANPDTDYYIE